MPSLNFLIISGIVGMVVIRLGNLGNNEPVSQLWFLEPILFAIFLLGSKFKSGLTRFRFFPISPMVLYIISSWIVGMAYELTLSQTPGNIGGMHTKTIPSFILAQGSYISLPVLVYILIRRYRLNIREVYLAGATISLAEGILFNKVLLGIIFSPLFFLAPIVFAYYSLVYGMILALPLTFIDEQKLWGTKKHSIGIFRLLLSAFLLGLLSWIIFYLWAVCVDKIFNGFSAF